MHDELDQEYEEELTQGSDHQHHRRSSLDCAFCRGTGVHPSTMHLLNHSHCPVCEGTGIMKFKGDLNHCQPCLRCGSSGREPDSNPPKPCSSCGGYGVI
jgi:DnaJ-class molecular chaperone